MQRDLLWTIAIALVTSAVYIPTIYNPTWGTPADYVSAFAAGFIGKAAINWAALPLFQSLRSTKAAAVPVTAPSSSAEATTGTATASAAKPLPADAAATA